MASGKSKGSKLIKKALARRTGPPSFFDRLTKTQQRDLLEAIREVQVHQETSFESLATAASQEFGVKISGYMLRAYVRKHLSCQRS